MKFSIRLRRQSRLTNDGQIVSSRDFESSVVDQMQVLPYMIDAPPTRRGRACILPRSGLCFFSRQRQHVIPANELPPYETMLRLDEKNPKRGVKASVLSKLSLVHPSISESAEGCLICLDSFPEGIAKQMPCSHLFCKRCIGTWLCTNRSCPVCRFEFSDADTHLIIPK